MKYDYVGNTEARITILYDFVTRERTRIEHLPYSVIATKRITLNVITKIIFQKMLSYNSNGGFDRELYPKSRRKNF